MREIAVFALCLMLPTAILADLRIEGLSGALEQNVRGFVDLNRERCDAAQWRIQRRFRSAPAQAREALEPFGYYSPTIESELEIAVSCWEATLTIDPGPQVLFRNVDISITGAAETDRVFLEPGAPPGLAPGAPLMHSVYDRYKESLQVKAAERGYAEATFTESSLDIWPDELAADVTLHFDSGPRYRFGELNIEQDLLDDSLVERYLALPYDTPYDGSALTDAYRALSNSGYFSNIQITPAFDRAEDGRIPIDIALQPGNRIEYNVGAGYATDTGARLRLGFRNRRLNERGHRLETDLRMSSVRTGLIAEYRKPLANPRTEWMSYTGALETDDTETSESDRIRLGVRRTRQITRNWLMTRSVDFNYERFIVGTVEDSSRLILPAVALDHKRSDRDINPTRGRRLGAELRGTAVAIGSTTSFAQILARARFIRSPTEKTRVIARATVGFTAKSEFDELPPSVRFFAGGDESIRGFDYESLGPKDEDGNVIGGSNLFVASLEYERQLKGSFYGAVFIDGGNAFDGFTVSPAYGTGLGIKWRSPLGPLRFYVAHPLNKSEDNIKLHVSLGADL